MAYPPRGSSLTSSHTPPIYHFNGSQPTARTTAPPRTAFDSTYPLSEDHPEKTGFSTPDEESEIPLAHAFPHSHPTHHRQAPLINYVKNDWRIGTTLGTGEEDDEFCPEGWTEILCSRAFKRWMLLYVLLTTIWLIWWFEWYQPSQKISQAEKFLEDSLRGRFLQGSEYGYFGANRRVEITGIKLLGQSDRRLVPGSDVPGMEGRRLVVVGDINGCADELDLLLQKLSFNPTTDLLVTTGNMISPSPSSHRVLQTLIDHQASCVRGTSEDRILYAHRDHHSTSHQKILAPDSPAKPSAISLKRGRKQDLDLAASLTTAEVEYLSSCPVILSLGRVPSMGNVSIVHGGLIPGLALEKQDPMTVMSIRTIDLRNHNPSFLPPPNRADGPPPRPRSFRIKPDYTNWDDLGRLAVLPWGEVWDKFQDAIPKLKLEGEELVSKAEGKGTKTLDPYEGLQQSFVIHGHDPGNGIVEARWRVGLNGECHEGGKLAALVIEESSDGQVDRRIVDVDCRR